MWWPRSVSATVQLIILKPVIALVFAVGLGMAGTSSGVESLLAGLLVLALGRVRLAGHRAVLHLHYRAGVQLGTGRRARLRRQA